MEQATQFRRQGTSTAKESTSKEIHSNNGSSHEAEVLTDSDEDLASPFNEQNIALVFGQRKLHVKKEHLIAVSPVFEAMFSSKFKEGSLTEISLPDKKLSHFVYFLRYLFPGFNDRLREDTAYDILPLADEYQTDGLKNRIEKFLIKILFKSVPIASVDIIEKILEAERYNLNGYLNKCIDIASRKKIQTLRKSPKFEEITKKTQLKISLKRWEDIDNMHSQAVKINPNFTEYLERNRSRIGAPSEYAIDIKDVGEHLGAFMNE
ncbi:BTB and MATH domain-containing protein 38-like [Mytilus edulis]|uniref:BTB and MATH domain-containing protein 38-like n=1 Tax=Mytilus edulis TaxID=6550 RepID=UPI0039EE2A6B